MDWFGSAVIFLAVFLGIECGINSARVRRKR